MKLYELTQNYNNLMELIDNPEVSNELIEESLNTISEDIEVKFENIGKVIRTLESEAAALKAESQRIDTLRKHKDNKIKSLKDYIENSMRVIDKNKIKSNLFTFSIQKNPVSVEIIDETIIPKKFFQVKKEVMKKDILEALKEGKKVKGCALKQTEGLRVR